MRLSGQRLSGFFTNQTTVMTALKWPVIQDELIESQLLSRNIFSLIQIRLEPTVKLATGPIQQQNKPAVIVIDTQTRPIFLKQDWVMQQIASHYTFQLMGSWDREEIYAFIEQYALVGNVAVFESMRNGRIWHVLIYGSFANKKAALKASNEWPAPLNTLPSWLRRLDSVQKQIKNKAVIE